MFLAKPTPKPEPIVIVKSFVTKMGIHAVTIRQGTDYGFGCGQTKNAALDAAKAELEANRG